MNGWPIIIHRWLVVTLWTSSVYDYVQLEWFLCYSQMSLCLAKITRWHVGPWKTLINLCIHAVLSVFIGCSMGSQGSNVSSGRKLSLVRLIWALAVWTCQLVPLCWILTQIYYCLYEPWLQGYKTLSCSTQLSMKI